MDQRLGHKRELGSQKCILSYLRGMSSGKMVRRDQWKHKRWYKHLCKQNKELSGQREIQWHDLSTLRWWRVESFVKKVWVNWKIWMNNIRKYMSERCKQAECLNSEKGVFNRERWRLLCHDHFLEACSHREQELEIEKKIFNKRRLFSCYILR